MNKKSIYVLFIFSTLLFFILGCSAGEGKKTALDIQDKAQTMQTKVDAWIKAGNDPAKIQPLLEKFGNDMKNQEFEKAGLAINEILEFIENTTQAPDQKQLQSNTSVSSTKTPNGKIAFVTNRDGNDEIYIMNSDGTGATRLTDNPASDNDPNWSPDGTKIGFRSERGGGSGIYVMNADGSNVNRLSPVPGFDSQPTWSPDGTKIAFSSTRDGQPEIYVMNADGTNAKRLTFNVGRPQAEVPPNIWKAFGFDIYSMDAQPAWSPGSNIVFWSNRDGNQNLYSMNSDGSGLKQLTFTKASNGDPAWSPDGSKIAFGSNRDGTHPNIYIMNADGSNIIKLTNFADPYEAGDMSWSPDGKKITFQYDARGASEGEVWIINADGSNPTSTGQKCDPNNCAPRWQPVVS